MNHIRANPQPGDNLSKAVGLSIALHIAVVLAFTIRTVFYPSEALRLEDAIRVDIVGLPDKAKQKENPLPPPASVEAPKDPAKPNEIKSEAKPEPKSEAKPEPKPVVELPKPDAPKVNLDKAKRDQQAALKRLEALEKLQKMASNSPTSAQSSSSNTKSSESRTGDVVRGNEVSAGSSLRGIPRLEHDSYLRSIHSRIKSQWNLPQWLATANLSARVRLYVDSQGNVVKKEMVQPSQDPVYNERVLKAIEAASPLPPPPSSLVNLLVVDGIELDFVPQ